MEALICIILGAKANSAHITTCTSEDPKIAYVPLVATSPSRPLLQATAIHFCPVKHPQPAITPFPGLLTCRPGLPLVPQSTGEARPKYLTNSSPIQDYKALQHRKVK